MKNNIVSLEKCSGYKQADLKKVLIRSFKNIGGLEKFVLKGETVLLKVNLLMKAKPEDAVTVHPEFVSALSEVLTSRMRHAANGDRLFVATTSSFWRKPESIAQIVRSQARQSL